MRAAILFAVLFLAGVAFVKHNPAGNGTTQGAFRVRVRMYRAPADLQEQVGVNVGSLRGQSPPPSPNRNWEFLDDTAVEVIERAATMTERSGVRLLSDETLTMLPLGACATPMPSEVRRVNPRAFLGTLLALRHHGGDERFHRVGIELRSLLPFFGSEALIDAPSEFILPDQATLSLYQEHNHSDDQLAILITIRWMPREESQTVANASPQ